MRILKKIFFLAPVLSLMLTGCGNDNDFPSLNTEGGGGDEPVVLNDTIKIDETPLANESESIIKAEDDGYKDFIENYKWDDELHAWDGSSDWNEGVNSLTLTFTDDDVNVVFRNKKGNIKSIDPDEFSITKDGGHITIYAHKKCHYYLSGNCKDGSLKIYPDKKFIVTLQGLNLTNSKGSAINIQKGIDGSKRCFLEIADGTKNYLTDGSSYSTPADEDEKGCIFSEGVICTSGSGYLNVTSNSHHGIASDDYVYLHKGPQITITPAPGCDGIKGKDEIKIGGGVLNITLQGIASKGLNSEGSVTVSGGRCTVVSSSVAGLVKEENDEPYCVKSLGDLTVSDGTLLLSASKEGGNGIYALNDFIQSGGTVQMIIQKTPVTATSTKHTGGILRINGKDQ